GRRRNQWRTRCLRRSRTLTERLLSVGLVSLGCAKNLVDTQVMSGVLLTEGLTLAPDPEHADVVLVNTCAFIQSARDEAGEAIARACAHKAAGGCRAVVVAGCLPQRYRQRLRSLFPTVDAWLGVDQLESVAAIVRRSVTTQVRRRRAEVDVTAQPRALFTPRMPALVFSGGPFAYLKIAEGCNRVCSFCAIPGIRGRQRSRRLPDLVAEARALLAAGMREINLISQDTTSYGGECRGAPRLPELLRALDALDGDFWLRLLYGYPSRLNDDLLATLADARHVVRYLDVPIQHSHPDILRAMRRADTVNVLPDMPRRLRAALPGVTLRTTCMTGFPGETEAHFRHLLDYVAAARFDRLGVFAFSPEEGTVAAELPGRVPAEVAEERRERLLRLQSEIARGIERARVGTGVRLLLLKPSARSQLWIARAPWQAPDVDGVTRVDGVAATAHAGRFVRARIAGIRGCDLRAVCSAS
ncbi:MAG: 30S ribosomal protein S12 methylthiotransferase RimO, partial [Kiritimatiellae bacterium]|nr:30S ribosomal protein S12 methylthiotransferase RimO [Kiritimatiellia bacterium]